VSTEWQDTPDEDWEWWWVDSSDCLSPFYVRIYGDTVLLAGLVALQQGFFDRPDCWWLRAPAPPEGVSR